MSNERRTAAKFLSSVLTSPLRMLVFMASIAAACVGWGEVLTVDTDGWSEDGRWREEVEADSGTERFWSWEKLGEPFADGAARFVTGSRIVSPTWHAFDILGVDVKLRCSTNAPSRFLQISFMRDSRVVAGPNRFEAVFRDNRAESQRVPVRREKHANGLALSLSDGALGDWGVYEICVATVATTRKEAGFAVIMQ